MKIKSLTVLFLTVFIFSCGNVQRENIETLLQSWSGKEIQFPTHSIFTIGGKDTINFDMSGNFKILTYVDSIGCVSCKLQLNRWKAFMEELNGIGLSSVKFLFFFSPEKRRDFLGTLKSENFTHPICIDEENKLNELNSFPLAFHTFLLDKDNKVLAVGNPIHAPKVKELYMKIIQGDKVERENKNPVINTQIHMEQTSISLGYFDWQKEQKVTFILKNVGDKPFVVEYVNTSCGCITVEYPQKPVQPREELALNAIYKADHPGHFNKTIVVYCNAESSPLTLKISGTAK